MAEKLELTFSDGVVEYSIHEHLAVLEEYPHRETPWRKEANIVSWNGGEPKIDIRDWSSDYQRMSRGITLTDEQAEKLAKALSERYFDRAKHARKKPARDDMER